MTVGTVTVWRNEILPPTETFIVNQMSALSRWRPRIAGLRRAPSALLKDAAFVADDLPRLRALGVRGTLYARGWSNALVRALAAEETRLVHAHFGLDGALIARSAARAGLPLVVTFHGYDATADLATLTPRYRRSWDHLVGSAAAFVAVSDFIAGKLTERGADAARVHVLPIGIPVGARPSGGSPRDGVLFVGRLVEKKGCDHLLRAVAALPEAVRGVAVHIVGDGPLRADLEQLARELRVEATFHGRKSPAEVSAMMERSTLFCVPSLTAASGDAEGFGMVFLEAAAAGLPTVSYRSGGTGEAIEDGVTGLLAPEKDVRELTACLAALLNDPARAAGMGAAGRARVEQEFDIRTRTAALEDLYDAVAMARLTV